MCSHRRVGAASLAYASTAQLTRLGASLGSPPACSAQRRSGDRHGTNRLRRLASTYAGSARSFVADENCDGRRERSGVVGDAGTRSPRSKIWAMNLDSPARRSGIP